MKSEFLALYKSQRWIETRWRIIRRDKGACTVCGAFQVLAVHHEKYVGNHPADTPDEFLKTLCHHCHQRAHGIERICHDFTTIGEILADLRNTFAGTDEPNASNVVDCCLYLEEALR